MDVAVVVLVVVVIVVRHRHHTSMQGRDIVAMEG